MPKITCPSCGTERVVVEGKKKKCRKCGTKLTSQGTIETPPGGKPLGTRDQIIAEITLAELKQSRPDLIPTKDQVLESLTVDELEAARPDLIFQVIEQSGPATDADAKEESEAPYIEWTKDELAQELTNREIEYTGSINKAAMVELLEADDEIEEG